MSADPAFALHPRLADDTVSVLSGPLSDVRLMNDRRFPWLILIPRGAGLVEIGDLPTADRVVLIEEAVAASNAIKAVTGCPRTNTAALGNQVPQLHVHVIGRRDTDAAWPGPVWGIGAAEAYESAAQRDLIEAVRDAFDLSRISGNG